MPFLYSTKLDIDYFIETMKKFSPQSMKHITLSIEDDQGVGQIFKKRGYKLDKQLYKMVKEI